MYKINLLFCILFLLSACNSEDISESITDVTESITSDTSDSSDPEESTSLADVINQYRVKQGLNAIPLSVSLTMVAEAHVADLENNNPYGSCNLHSWSNQGNWSACCYTGDHAKAQCMWDKPREITDEIYSGYGYEISAQNSGKMTAKGALEQWKGSTGHHNVILNRDIWADNNWRAIGAAVSAHYAVVWFGTESDPAGSP